MLLGRVAGGPGVWGNKLSCKGQKVFFCELVPLGKPHMVLTAGVAALGDEWLGFPCMTVRALQAQRPVANKSAYDTVLGRWKA